MAELAILFRSKYMHETVLCELYSTDTAYTKEWCKKAIELTGKVPQLTVIVTSENGQVSHEVEDADVYFDLDVPEKQCNICEVCPIDRVYNEPLCWNYKDKDLVKLNNY